MKHNGFSLLELSIVLVIIGLIAGGIVAGASMIRAAELRAILTEHSQYKTAVNTFRDKYLGIPGDLRNAGAFWGYPSGSAANCPATAGSGTETCDGDSDGELTISAASIYTERHMFWQHLANAELVSSTFTGMSGPGGGNDSVIDENVPTSAISPAVWVADTRNNNGGSPLYFDFDYGNHFILAIDESTGNSRPHGEFLTAGELWNLDTKIDDGNPGKGEVIAGNISTCTSTSDITAFDSATYNLTNDDIACNAFFRRAF